MPLLAVVPCFERTDGLPFWVHFSSALDLPFNASTSLKSFGGPLTGILDNAIGSDPMLHVHQPMLEVALVQGFLVSAVLQIRRPQVCDFMEVSVTGIHAIGPLRRVAQIVGHPFKRPFLGNVLT